MGIRRDSQGRTVDQPDVGWFTVGSKGHLFLVSPTTRHPPPVCGIAEDGRDHPPWHRDDCVACDKCDAYLFEVYLPQIS